MRIKNVILMLLLLLFLVPMDGKVEVEINENNISVRTNTKGVGGDSEECIDGNQVKRSPYVFILYSKKPNDKDENQEVCLCGLGVCKWEKERVVSSTIPYMLFEELPLGKYKVEVLTGFAHNCEYENDLDESKPKSISYTKETSVPFELTTTPIGIAQKRRANVFYGSLEVYPNPSTDILNIQLRNGGLEKEAQIKLYDIQGKELQSQSKILEEPNSLIQARMDIKNHSSGMYILRVMDNQGTSYEQRIIIQKD